MLYLKSRNSPVTTVPDVAIHHTLHNKTTSEFKGEPCLFCSTNSTTGTCKINECFQTGFPNTPQIFIAQQTGSTMLRLTLLNSSN